MSDCLFEEEVMIMFDCVSVDHGQTGNIFSQGRAVAALLLLELAHLRIPPKWRLCPSARPVFEIAFMVEKDIKPQPPPAPSPLFRREYYESPFPKCHPHV